MAPSRGQTCRAQLSQNFSNSLAAKVFTCGQLGSLTDNAGPSPAIAGRLPHKKDEIEPLLKES